MHNHPALPAQKKAAVLTDSGFAFLLNLKNIKP